MTDSLRTYLNDLKQSYQTGQATEHTHRPALKTLLESLTRDVTVLNEPRRRVYGAPDYVIQRGSLPIGCIEAKDIGKPLAEVAKSEQVQRYTHAHANVLLTNYLDFLLFVNGQADPRGTASIARLSGAQIVNTPAQWDMALTLINDFLNHQPEAITTPEELAAHMARLTRPIRDIIIEKFEHNEASRTLQDLRDTFAQTLIPHLDDPSRLKEFADMYAQTLAYGLFAARCHFHVGQASSLSTTVGQASSLSSVDRQDACPTFSRAVAMETMPHSNPFLRDLFEIITGQRLNSEPYLYFVDELARVLDKAALEEILAKFADQKDPVIHFYETFLKAYDPKVREQRGVYYTPPEVVSYIVRSVDKLLRQRFGLTHGPGGLGDTSTQTFVGQASCLSVVDRQDACPTIPKVLILDPAVGTGTFLYAVIDQIRQQFRQANQGGMWSGYVRQHLLPRLFGFEVLMTPYTIAHLKLDLQLSAHDMPPSERATWAYKFREGERLHIYLTNTLEEVERRKIDLRGLWRAIAEESHAAESIKQEMPLLVVMGNPPYSGHSATSGRTLNDEGKSELNFIGKLVRNYYFLDGQPLGERNPKWLQDDYVKFIRWGQWRIDQTGQGVLAFITNHGYLDNPTFRGMRQSLLNSFSDIYILNLHGNIKKKETAPDGSKDENVFDIQQGVAIAFFIKEKDKARPGQVHYADLWGERAGKYQQLTHSDITTTTWTDLKPQAPFYLFVPQNVDLLPEYQAGWKVTDIFPVNSVGIVTARDKLTVHWSLNEMWETVQEFSRLPVEEARQKYSLGNDARDWKVNLAQDDLKISNGPHYDKIVPILYRVFDHRFTYYTGKTRGFICMPRSEVMRNMIGKDNLGFITIRRSRDKGDWRYVFVTDKIIAGATSLTALDINYLFPLYLYPDQQARMNNLSPYPPGEGGRVPNLDPEFVAALEARLGLKLDLTGFKNLLGLTFTPEDIFHYAYAIFHSPTYRARYAEFLKIDFPRLPLTGNIELFRQLAKVGQALVSLHLLESPTLNHDLPSYPVAGNNDVAKGYPKFEVGQASCLSTQDRQDACPTGRVYINKTQYFEGVPLAVWEFQIGGYQVCEKWLKDRQGRQLDSWNEVNHYQKIVVALRETLRLMAQVDSLIESWPLR